MEEKFIRDALMLWATIDPIGTLSLFAAVTVGMSSEQRRRTAIKATLYGFAILAGSIVIGQILLTGMGIDLLSLQVAGGVILFLFALQMIFGELDASSAGPEADRDLAVFPLAVPSIAGPGGIVAVVLLTDNHIYSIPVQLGTTLIMVGVLIVTCLMMLASGLILKVIGGGGAKILIRVMGIILAALSVQLVFEALAVERWVTGSP
ncbi:MAG: MarC family protein [Gammaproteobacteria bacterium]